MQGSTQDARRPAASLPRSSRQGRPSPDGSRFGPDGTRDLVRSVRALSLVADTHGAPEAELLRDLPDETKPRRRGPAVPDAVLPPLGR